MLESSFLKIEQVKQDFEKESNVVLFAGVGNYFGLLRTG
jgi:hypothetical protein